MPCDHYSHNRLQADLHAIEDASIMAACVFKLYSGPRQVIVLGVGESLKYLAVCILQHVEPDGNEASRGAGKPFLYKLATQPRVI
jgi:hypothetical protein